MNVLIFGGSFDPPHRGHAALLEAAAQRLRPDHILIFPAFHAPLKKTHAAPARDRLRMIRIGLLPLLNSRWRRITRIDSGELRSRRRVFTVETLARLKAEHPDWQLNFVVGSDGAAAWKSWKAPHHLARLCRWWTALRPGIDPKSIPGHFTFLRRPMPAISSTDLRADIAAGIDVSRELHPATRRFIFKNKLYGSGLCQALEAGLTPQRLVHTHAVRALAESLAIRWGEDPRRASWAGLLHDCGRLIKDKHLAAYARCHHLQVPARAKIIRYQPNLLHAYVGEDLARKRFRCQDQAVLKAVRRHTLGAPSLSRLDIILYVADTVSKDRTHPAAPRLRRLAFKDLDAAFKECLAAKLTYAAKKGGWIHPLSVSLWKSLHDKRS